jgi:hypothetical protein
MFRRRRRMKKLVRVARMLRELDSAAAEIRPEPRRPGRIAVGRI